MKYVNKHSVEMADSIEKLATFFCGYAYHGYFNDDREHPIPKAAVMELLEMGAEWQKQQMMKDAVGANVYSFNGESTVDWNCVIPNTHSIKSGDKVKVVIIKEN